MFRSVAQRALATTHIARGSVAAAAAARTSGTTTKKVFFSSAAAAQPTVHDMVIDLTFIDPSGARRKVKGLIGKTLHEICEMHGIDIGPSSPCAPPEVARTETWTEPTFGEGVMSGYDHVVLVGPGADTAARKTEIEEQMLDDYWDWDEIFEGSRLASAITLTKEMDGMTVYVPDRIVDDCP